MENQHPEALILVNDRPSTIGDDLYQWALDAEDMIRRLHTRVEEIEKDRGNAKRLVSKIWNQHPEARGTIEEGTGAWLVFGQDVETSGVSAQRVTQSQPLKASSDWLIDGGLLYRLNDEGTNCDEINVTMAGGLRTEAARVERAGEILNMLKAVQQAEDCIEQPLEMVAAPAELNLDDYYCKGCGRIGEIEELNAQDKEKLRKIEGKPKTVAAPVEVVIDFERVGSAGPFEVVEGRVAIPVVTMLDLARMLKPTTDALSAAPVVLPEPNAWAAVYFSGKQAGKIYTTCDTKEQIEAYIHQVHQSNDSITLRAEPIYMRAAAPHLQADARDAQRYRWLRAQPIESDNSMFCITIWRKGTDGFGDDLRLEELDAAIDAAIAAAKEMK